MTLPQPLPALLGGRPLRPQGSPGWPLAEDDVRRALLAALEARSWGKYHAVYLERLGKRLRKTLGVAFALACGSGTFAVELALRALKVGPGDEVILAAYDFPG